MARATRKKDWARIEREIQQAAFADLLRSLQERQDVFKQFNSWKDVMSFMRQGDASDDAKDAVLRPILQAYQGNGDANWSTVLLAMFWVVLESIHLHRSRWDSDDDERWQNFVLTFLTVLRRLDLARRPNLLVHKIINDTIHRTHDYYRRHWRDVNSISSIDDLDLDKRPARYGDPETPELFEREERELQLRRLRKFQKLGRIDKTDFDLLAGTRVYGMPLKQYASLVGISVEAAKKRRQRAEARLRSFA